MRVTTEFQSLFCQNPKMPLTQSDHHPQAKELPLDSGVETNHRSDSTTLAGVLHYCRFSLVKEWKQTVKQRAKTLPNQMISLEVTWIHQKFPGIRPVCKCNHSPFLLYQTLYQGSFRFVHTQGWTSYYICWITFQKNRNNTFKCVFIGTGPFSSSQEPRAEDTHTSTHRSSPLHLCCKNYKSSQACRETGGSSLR